jgi:predicted ArsR family transcriptional regulator
VQSVAAPDDTPRVLHPSSEQLRTLAHPLRSRLLGALRFHGPATSTALAARLGTNSGATSYHLRQLAEVGLVEDDEERSNGRDRWWRAAHDATSWRTGDFDDDPDARAADDWLLRRQARTTSGWLHDWLDQRDDWSVEWRDAADQSDYHLELTAAGLRSLMDELHAVVAKHRDAPAPDGAERVTVLLQAFPSPERMV